MIDLVLGLLPAGAAGAAAGSFAATAGLRAARSEQAIFGRSHCDVCGRTLGLAATIPLASYVARRGACRDCGARIDPLHLVGEAAGAAIGVAALAIGDWTTGLLFAGLAFVLLAASIVDAKSKRLFDGLTLAAAALCVGLAIIHGPGRAIEGAVAAAIAFALMEGVRRAFLWMRRTPGLGLGDVKLIAALALWLGVATPHALAAASLLGLAVVALRRPADGRIAFGPWISVGALLTGYARDVLRLGILTGLVP